MTNCPEQTPDGKCGFPTWERRRFVLESTDGMVEHIALICAIGHTLIMPVVMLEEGQP